MRTVRFDKLNGKHAAQFEKVRGASERKRLCCVDRLIYVVRTYPSGRTFGEFHVKDVAHVFQGFGCKTRSLLVLA